MKLWLLIRQSLSTDRLGVPGVAGIGLGLFCLSFYTSTLYPLEEEARALETEASALKHTLSSFKVTTPNAEAARALTSAPPSSIANAAELVDKLAAVADKNGLSIDQTSYHLQESQDQRRVDVSLPIKSSYPVLRQYLRDAFALEARTTLEELHLQRAQSSDPLIEASLRLSYALRTP